MMPAYITIQTFRLPMEAFIGDDSHTRRRYCINTEWMTDGDRSREVEVRREQENTKAQHTSRDAE